MSVTLVGHRLLRVFNSKRFVFTSDLLVYTTTEIRSYTEPIQSVIRQPTD